MADAPVTIVACGFPDRAYKTMGGSGNSVEIDVALDHLTPLGYPSSPELNHPLKDGQRKMDPGRPAFTRITFKDKGLTSIALRIWSMDTLMDLDR